MTANPGHSLNAVNSRGKGKPYMAGGMLFGVSGLLLLLLLLYGYMTATATAN